MWKEKHFWQPSPFAAILCFLSHANLNDHGNLFTPGCSSRGLFDSSVTDDLRVSFYLWGDGERWGVCDIGGQWFSYLLKGITTVDTFHVHPLNFHFLVNFQRPYSKLSRRDHKSIELSEFYSIFIFSILFCSNDFLRPVFKTWWHIENDASECWSGTAVMNVMECFMNFMMEIYLLQLGGYN